MSAPVAYAVDHEPAVDRGVALLDERLGRGVWLPRVNLDALSVGSCDRCVVCHATGIPHYGEALESIALNLDVIYASWDSSTSWTEEHGFGLSYARVPTGGSRDFAGLQAAWIRRVTELRAAGEVTA